MSALPAKANRAIPQMALPVPCASRAPRPPWKNKGAWEHGAARRCQLTEILDNSQALDLANGHGQLDWPAVPLGGLHIRTCKAPARVTSTCHALRVCLVACIWSGQAHQMQLSFVWLPDQPLQLRSRDAKIPLEPGSRDT
jgi:hypothetical protein